MTVRETTAGVLLSLVAFVAAAPAVRYVNVAPTLVAYAAEKPAEAAADFGMQVPQEAVVAVISGPSTSPVGELAILDSADSKNASAFSWVAVPSTAKNWLVIDGGKRCVATQPKPGELTLILAASGTGGGISLASRTVAFTGTPAPPTPTPPAPPPNPPAPEPPSPPGPPVPDGFDFRKAARGWLGTVTGDPIQVRSEAASIAKVFSSVADSAAAGTFTSVDDVVKATGTGIGTVLHDNSRRSAWAPFGVSLAGTLKAEFDSGRLTTVAQHAAAWRQIAAGLTDGGASRRRERTQAVVRR